MSDTQPLLNLIYIFLYEAACAIFLPLPSEAPMFLFPDLSRPAVLLSCALGKGFGSYLVFVSGDRFRRTSIFSRIIKLLRLEMVWERFDKWTARFMDSYGFTGFLFLMSIPGMPMRSAIYSVSVLKINAIQFSLGSAIGTVIRCLIVYSGFWIFSRYQLPS